MYYIKPGYYCQSELKSLERRASDSLRVLNNKLVTREQIGSIREWLERLRERLEIENPRCKTVDVRVTENSTCERLDIRFGNLAYYGVKCSALTVEDLAE